MDESEEEDEDDVCDVEEILKERPSKTSGKPPQFLIRWLGYAASVSSK